VDGRVVLAGVLVGFLACVSVGRSYSMRGTLSDVERLHPAVAPETNFFATSTQLAAAVARRARHGRVIVVVGGNSIFYGSGQPAEQLWTRELQRLLGDRFAVCNLALRGATFAEGGAVVAEILHGRGHRVIYVANTSVAGSATPFEGPYAYLFWDAYFKGALTADPARDATIPAALAAARKEPAKRDALIGQRLNGALFFNDLWTAFAYERAATSYSHLLLPDLWAPRSASRDTEGPPPADLAQRYRPEVRAFETRIVGGVARNMMRRDEAGHLVPNEAEGRWHVADRLNPVALPRALRERTVMAVIHDSSYYIDLQPGDGPAEYRAAVAESARRLRAMGFADAVPVGADFTPADYADRAHLAPAGGAKMAAALAPAVRGLAERLGYLR
jgi:hypothetical protein